MEKAAPWRMPAARSHPGRRLGASIAAAVATGRDAGLIRIIEVRQLEFSLGCDVLMSAVRIVEPGTAVRHRTWRVRFLVIGG